MTVNCLGAQIVGYDGVDKRIDVLATSIRAGFTVYDLEQLELAYSPPYGSAKDPINMAGFVAANLLKGDVEFWYAEDYDAVDSYALVVDVREVTEYQAWHLPNAVNIPLSQLRSQLATLSQDRPILLYCRVGFRSYMAYRILVQSVSTMSRRWQGVPKLSAATTVLLFVQEDPEFHLWRMLKKKWQSRRLRPARPNRLSA